MVIYISSVEHWIQIHLYELTIKDITMGIKQFYYLSNVTTKKLTTQTTLLLYNYLKKLNSGEWEFNRNVNKLDAYKFRGDFFSLLNTLGIPPYMHVPTLYLNDLSNSEDYNGGVYDFKVYTMSTTEKIKEFLERIATDKI